MQFYTNLIYAAITIFLPGGLYLQYLFFTHLADALPAAYAAGAHCLHRCNTGHWPLPHIECDH